MTESCGSCRFRQVQRRDELSGIAPCRRFPPIENTRHPAGGTTPVWPGTNSWDWCGEWQAHAAPAKVEEADESVCGHANGVSRNALTRALVCDDCGAEVGL